MGPFAAGRLLGSGAVRLSFNAIKNRRTSAIRHLTLKRFGKIVVASECLGIIGFDGGKAKHHPTRAFSGKTSAFRLAFTRLYVLIVGHSMTESQPFQPWANP